MSDIPKGLWRRLISARDESAGASARRDKRCQPTIDGLEGRLVLSRMGGMGGAMAERAAMFARAGSFGSTTEGAAADRARAEGFTGRRGGPGGFDGGGRRGGVRDVQLATDLRSYQAAATDVFRDSSVTDADRLALREAFDALGESGVTFDREALAIVTDGILAALADPDDATTAESFREAFIASLVGATGEGDDDSTLTQDELVLANAAFDAFVAVADGLDVDSDERAALTTASEAIADDYERLGIEADPPSALDLVLGGPGGGPRRTC